MEKVKRLIEVECPRCGNRFDDYIYFPIANSTIFSTYNDRSFILCDPDDGGCDEYFAVKARVDFAVVSSYKIDEV